MGMKESIKQKSERIHYNGLKGDLVPSCYQGHTLKQPAAKWQEQAKIEASPHFM